MGRDREPKMFTVKCICPVKEKKKKEKNQEAGTGSTRITMLQESDKCKNVLGRKERSSKVYLERQ